MCVFCPFNVCWYPLNSDCNQAVRTQAAHQLHPAPHGCHDDASSSGGSILPVPAGMSDSFIRVYWGLEGRGLEGGFHLPPDEHEKFASIYQKKYLS